MTTYQNYHKHSYYSNLSTPDSVTSYEDYAKRAVELGHKILSSVEHGNQGRYIECYELAKQYDLKFLFGTEAYFVKDRKEKDGTNAHLVLLARNENGRQWINEILSEANISGFYRHARIDRELLYSIPKNDIWVTSACVAGVWKYESYEELLCEMHQYFGDNFFLEVQSHNTIPQRNINQEIIRLKNKYGMNIIAGVDSHYIFNDKAWERDDFLLSRGISYEDENGWYMDYPDDITLIKRFEEQGILTKSEIEESIENTNRFLDVEEYHNEIFEKNIKMPTIYPDKTQEEKNQIFEDLIWKLWEEQKYEVPKEKWDLYEREIKMEIGVVKDINHADYFLMDYAIVQDGITHGGWITNTGRGSAVSFFINKLLGFTKVDRISSDVKLYPERFLSKTRILETGSIADIDLNLGNPEVFRESQERILGENHAKEMIAYGTYKPKSAWKLFAKSQDVPFDVANAVTRQIEKYEKDLKEADAEERDYINIEDYIDKEYQEIFEKSKNYRGIISSVSPHACASLIYNKNIRRNIGLIKLRSKQGKEEHICALMDGKWAEKYKFLKNDLLKVSVVALIKELYKRIGIKEHTVSELLAECTPDHKVWDVYKNGWTLGINQVEQAGTSARVMKYKPTNISELCSFVAAIRPGFKSMYKKYENREDFAYNITTIDDLIRTPQFPQPYMLYQEQAMAVLNYAGIPMDLTYAVVKNIAKKREDEVKKYKDTFLDGMKKRIIEQEHKSQQEAEEIAHMTWQIIEDSTRYSFNACISKNTKIKVNKNGKDFVMTVDELYRELDLDYYAYSLFEDNKIRLNKIVDIRYAGYRQTYLIITKNGKKIYATSNHKFPTVFDGVKKLEDLTTEDYLYIMGDELDEYTYNSYIDKIESISLYKEEDVYDVEMEAPNHNFVIDNGIVTCNSHSLSVAIDSLYCAYLKVMYPLEFYETYIKIMTRENKKDKIILAQNEATTAFGIRTAPFKFREDNRGIKANKERNEISSSLATIKRFGKGISEELYGLKDFNGKYFCDLLKELQKTTLKSNQLEILILLDYFEEFGNSKELLEIVDTYNLLKGGEVKQISIENVQKLFLLEILPKFATDKGINGNQLKSFRVFDGNGLLHDCEDYIKSMEVPDFNDSEKVKIKMEYLGYIMPTGKDSDRPKIYINKMHPIYRRDNKKLCGYNFIATSIGSAKQSRYLIWDNVFKKNGSFSEGDIIKLCGFKKNGQSFEVTDYFLLTK